MAVAPLSAHELRDAVRQGAAFDPARLDRVLGIDAACGLVEVQSQTSWRAVAARLRPGDARAGAVHTTMATVGASVATNAAGPDGRPAAAHVEALTLVTPDGELRRVSRENNARLWSLAIGGHDLFGVLYSVTLRLDSLERALRESDLAPPAGGAGAFQLLVPPERVAAYLAQARSRCSAWRIALGAVEVRRTLEDGETFLRWARREYAEVSLRLAAGATLGTAVRLTQLRRELIDDAIAQDGSFPIANTPEATRPQIELCYPQLKSFLAEKRRLDPLERLVNPWYCHHRSLLAREPCEVRWGL